ncbi:hypothetical protein GCM10017687_29160 [Streptomyces echinatus]
MTRSWWGWGNVEDAVGGAELRALLDRVTALMPGELTDHEPPGIASLGLSAPPRHPTRLTRRPVLRRPGRPGRPRARQGVPGHRAHTCRGTCAMCRTWWRGPATSAT